MRVNKQPYLTHEQERTASAELLVLSHGRLVLKMARNFSRYGMSIEDLVQEGNVALLYAAGKFDPTKGVRFSTYAVWWVRQKMREAVFANHSIVRASGSNQSRIGFFKGAPHKDISMQMPIAEGMTVADTFVSPDPGPDVLVEELLDSETRCANLRRAMSTLSLREQDVIKSRFLDERKQGLAELGERHSISKERVRQVELAALRKLKKELEQA